MQRTDFVGYRGLAKLNGVLLLASSAQATMNATPIKSNANWGAGSWNAAETAAWSADMPEISASIDCDVTTTAIGVIEEFSKRYKVSSGATPIVIRPSNSWGFNGAGYCESLSYKGQEQQNLTASIEAKAFFTDANSIKDFSNDADSTSMDDKTSDIGAGGLGDLAYNALYPYWGQTIYMRNASGENTRVIPRTRAEANNQITGITDWSAQLTHNIQFKKTCGIFAGNGQSEGIPTAEGGWPLAPDYVALGAMTGQCDLTFVGMLDEFDYDYYYNTRGFKAEFTSPVGGGAHSIIIPAMLCESYPISLQSGGEFITASFSYTAVGNGFDPPVKLGAW